MANALVTWWRALTTKEPDKLEALPAPSGFAAGTPSPAEYDQRRAMSAYAGSAWVYAAGNAIVTDYSTLPFRVMRGDDDVTETHPMGAMLANPGRSTSMQRRGQEILDFTLSGNAYTVRIMDELWRVGPALMEPITDHSGRTVGYLFDGSDTIPASAVVHVRAATWTDDSRSLTGQGAIRALDLELQADISAQALGKRYKLIERLRARDRFVV